MRMLILALLLFFIASCAPSVVCPDGTVVKDAEDCPTVQEALDHLQDVQDAMDDLEEVVEEPGVMDADIQELFDKTSKVKSGVSFTYSGTEKLGSEYVQITKRTYSLLGDKVKITIPTIGMYSGDIEADVVYLDLASRTAKGFCTEGKNCATPQPRDVIFEDYMITFPESWIEQVPTNAYIKGDKQFDGNTPMTVIQYEQDGLYYEMLVQPFYGMPVSLAAYETESFGSMLWKYEYRDMAYNLVKEADVTPPE